MPKQTNKKLKNDTTQTGGRGKKGRALVIRVGPPYHPRPRRRPPRPPRTAVVCNIL